MSQSPRLSGALPHGVEHAVLQKMQQLGISPKQWGALTSHVLPPRVARVINDHLFFTPPEEQIERMLEMGKIWGDDSITEGAIEDLGPPPPCPTPSDSELYTVFLNRETGDPARTLEDNIKALKAMCPCDVLMESCMSWHTISSYRTLGFGPGLYWLVVELGRELLDSDDPEKTMVEFSELDKIHRYIGQELPLIAALHPKWLHYIQRDFNVPALFAADIKITGRKCFEYPALIRDSVGRLTLDSISSAGGSAIWHTTTGRLYTPKEFCG